MVSKNTEFTSAKRIAMFATIALLTACGGSSDTTNEPEGTGKTGDELETEVILPQARGLLPDLAIHDGAFEGVYHSGNVECASCHSDDTVMSIEGELAGTTRDLSIGTAWETSLMAQGARDPYWHAVVASELDNFPGLEDEINDKCLVCHAPTAHDLAAKTGRQEELRLFSKIDETTGEVLQRGIYLSKVESELFKADELELFNHAMDGVTCTLCHQIEAANLGTEESMTGGYLITGSASGDINDRPAYGQYDDPEISYMRNNSGFNPQHGAHLSTSESCATCHNLNIDPVDPVSGEPIADVPHFAEQAIYTEWLLSDYAVGGAKEASCQDCHMPVIDQDVFIAQGATNKRPNFAEHTFLGANTVMQDMLKNFAEELGIELDAPGGVNQAEFRDNAFDESITRNREFLKTAATVTVIPGSIETNDSDDENSRLLNFDVGIENNTGHKLPAGYHSRRVYLHVQVLDADNVLVFESGKMGPDGEIIGVIEDTNPDFYEPHYDLITDETQVQVYQAIVSDINGNRTHSLLSGSGYLKDNRITPSGLEKSAVQSDTTLAESFGTFGAAFDDDDFNSGRDTVSYQVSVPQSRLYTVVAELRYQPLSYGHLQKLFTQGDDVDPVDRFRTMYEDREKTTFLDESIDTDLLIMQ